MKCCALFLWIISAATLTTSPQVVVASQHQEQLTDNIKDGEKDDRLTTAVKQINVLFTRAGKPSRPPPVRPGTPAATPPGSAPATDGMQVVGGVDFTPPLPIEEEAAAPPGLTPAATTPSSAGTILNLPSGAVVATVPAVGSGDGPVPALAIEEERPMPGGNIPVNQPTPGGAIPVPALQIDREENKNSGATPGCRPSTFLRPVYECTEVVAAKGPDSPASGAGAGAEPDEEPLNILGEISAPTPTPPGTPAAGCPRSGGIRPVFDPPGCP